MQRTSLFITTVFVVALLPILGGTAQGKVPVSSSPPEASQPVPEAGMTHAILGWTRFCEAKPEECAVDPAEPERIPLTAATWRTLLAVNRMVNETIHPLTDEEHWGAVDVWSYPEGGYGDCEDYQLLKRKMLVERGLPRRAMRMTVVIDDLGEGHAVLMVRTDRGDLILDNKTSAILPWHQTGYAFVKREGHGEASWVSLGGATSPTTTANR